MKKEIGALESRFQAAEAERAPVSADLESGAVISYSAAGQHLAALQEQLDTDTARWEAASPELERLASDLAADV